MSEVDKLLAGKYIYTDHNGVSATYISDYLLRHLSNKLLFQNPVYFPSSRVIPKVLLLSEQTWNYTGFDKPS